MNDLLEISTLGRLAIRLAGEPVTGLDSRKIEALLVYLACTGRPHSRDVLADLLQERAAKIEDGELHRLFLENVAANWEIIKAWAGSDCAK